MAGEASKDGRENENVMSASARHHFLVRREGVKGTPPGSSDWVPRRWLQHPVVEAGRQFLRFAYLGIPFWVLVTLSGL